AQAEAVVEAGAKFIVSPGQLHEAPPTSATTSSFTAKCQENQPFAHTTMGVFTGHTRPFKNSRMMILARAIYRKQRLKKCLICSLFSLNFTA
ncbi:MAG: hypothetical protein COA52_18605, partial [Hyphomicrobiales bacterium]